MPRVSRRHPWPFRLPRPFNTGTFSSSNAITDVQIQIRVRKIRTLTTYGENVKTSVVDRGISSLPGNKVDCPSSFEIGPPPFSPPSSFVFRRDPISIPTPTCAPARKPSSQTHTSHHRPGWMYLKSGESISTLSRPSSSIPCPCPCPSYA